MRWCVCVGDVCTRACARHACWCACVLANVCAPAGGAHRQERHAHPRLPAPAGPPASTPPPPALHPASTPPAPGPTQAAHIPPLSVGPQARHLDGCFDHTLGPTPTDLTTPLTTLCFVHTASSSTAHFEHTAFPHLFTLSHSIGTHDEMLPAGFTTRVCVCVCVGGAAGDRRRIFV